MILLLTGFGPFPGVPNNPTEALVRALHQTRIGEVKIHSAVLPVSYERAPERTVGLARELGAHWVIGTGVAAKRDHHCVEQLAVPTTSRDDIDGFRPTTLGREQVRATIACAAVATAMGAQLSNDAGTYVCNAWLHGVARRLHPTPVGFIHVAKGGMKPALLLAGLAAVIDRRP